MSTWYGIIQHSSIVQLYYAVFLTTENGLLYGLLFVAMGAHIASESKKNAPHNVGKLLIGLVISVAVMTLEVSVVRISPVEQRGSIELFALPFAVYFLFKLILKIRLTERPVYRLLRNMSTLIYLSHCWIMRLLMMLHGIMKINVSRIPLFMETLIVSVLFSIATITLAKKWKILKLLM